MNDRYYQTKAHDALVKFILDKKGNPFLLFCTAAGKSVNIAKMIKHFVGEWKANILTITHRKELVMQNYKTACKYWPEGRRYYGVNSASLNSRDYNKKAIFGTIKSVYQDAKLFTKINVLIIDEAHGVMVGKDAGMFWELINGLRKINPNMKIIGLSALYWREDAGNFIGWGRDYIFNEIVYKVTNAELVANKYLSPLVNKASASKPDISKVPLGPKGEFIEDQLEDVVISNELVLSQVNEIDKYIGNRKTSLVFCVTIKHSNMVYRELLKRGHKAVNINYKTSSESREKYFKSFDDGVSRFLVNVNIATEGYDNTNIDFIADLAPTNSLGRHVEKIGRGGRVQKVNCQNCETESTDFLPCLKCGQEVERFKKDCYILDCAGNTNRHGSIDEIEADYQKIPEKIKKFKKCPKCFEEVATHLRECPFCQTVFETQEQERRSSGKDTTSIPVLSEPVWMDVSKIQVSKSTKSPRTHIVVNIYAGGQKLLQNIEIKNPTPIEKWAVDIEQKINSGTEYCRMKLDRYANKPTKIQVISDHGNFKIIGVQCTKA